MKECYKCHEVKPDYDFARRSKSPDGKQLWCRICMNKSNQEKVAERKEHGPTVIKQSKVCNDCSMEKPIGQFYKKRNAADGHGSYCKPCWSKRVTRTKRPKLAGI